MQNNCKNLYFVNDKVRAGCPKLGPLPYSGKRFRYCVVRIGRRDDWEAERLPGVGEGQAADQSDQLIKPVQPIAAVKPVKPIAAVKPLQPIAAVKPDYAVYAS